MKENLEIPMVWRKKMKSFVRVSILVSVLLLGNGGNPLYAGSVQIEPTTLEGWNHCYRISNGDVELIAVADMGPRILRLGFVGGENVFFIDPQTVGKTGGDSWNGYGGHRLWIGPETADITYYPDNFAVHTQVDGNTLVLTAPIEVLDATARASMSYDEIMKHATEPEFRKKLGFQKQMEIRMEENGEVTILHRITNCGLQAHSIAAWALTVMNQGGICVLPNPPYAPHGPGHWLPERAIVTWSYTNMIDPRLKIMNQYMTFRQDPSMKEPLKMGFSSTQGWVAYALHDQLFVKKLDYFKDRNYPDMGCSVEIFTNASIMEVESLAPMVTLQSGETTTHRERWFLKKIAPITQDASSIETMLKSVGLQ